MPKSRVIDPAFTWGQTIRPRTPWNRTVIYEAHVRGFTMRHPQVPQAPRGNFSGLSDLAVIDYLTSSASPRSS